MRTPKRVEMTERAFRCLICLSAIVKLREPTLQILQIYIAGEHKTNLMKKKNFVLQEVQGPLEILFHPLHQASPTKKRTHFKSVYFKNLSPKLKSQSTGHVKSFNLRVYEQNPTV